VSIADHSGRDRGLHAAAPDAVRSALQAARELGQFFRLADPAADTAGWQPAAALYAAGDGPLDEVLATVRAGLGRCEPRVAASVFFQGYAARLLSPQLACVVTAGCLPQMPPGRLRWRRAGQAVELGLVPGSGWQAPGPVLMGQLITTAFGEHLTPLSVALKSRVRIASGVLRANAAAALVAGLRLLGDGAPGGSGWRQLAADALARPELHGSGSLHDGPVAYVRRSCCLYYLVPGGGLCGDCPISAPG
jgi:hypothetical protein